MPDPVSTETVTLPREHYDAIKRVLVLVKGYIAMTDGQHILRSDGHGLMTWAELLPHMRAAIDLMPDKRKAKKKPAKRKRR